jgi:DNA-binding CsgD family transcriptional regulator
MAIRKLEDGVAVIQAAKSPEEAFRQFNELMLVYGYDSNVYTLLTDHPSIGLPSTHGLEASYPRAWIDFYNSRHYQQSDPVWQRLLASPVPFFWGDVVDRLKIRTDLPEETVRASLRVMDEATEAGVADGIGISYVGPLGEMTAVGLSRTKGVKERHYEHLAEVYLLATFFHEKFMSFYRRRAPDPLTPREREVLLWASQNKSDSEIGEIMNVTSPTIRFHWKNIFAKLEVAGRLPAVIRALQMQIIAPQLIKAPYRPR